MQDDLVLQMEEKRKARKLFQVLVQQVAEVIPEVAECLFNLLGRGCKNPEVALSGQCSTTLRQFNLMDQALDGAFHSALGNGADLPPTSL